METKDNEKHEKFMREALKEALIAEKLGEVPVGCVIVKEDKIVSRAHNLAESRNDPTAHAEILAIRKAGRALKNWRLSGCFLYVNIEPCAMCAGAIVLSRITGLVYGVEDGKSGAVSSLYSIVDDKRLNHRVDKIVSGVLEGECREVLKNFFRSVRDR